LNLLGYGDLEPLEALPLFPGVVDIKIAGGIRLDVLWAIKGLEELSFGDCLNMFSNVELYWVNVPFLQINHLIDNKKIINRPKGQVDVIE